MSIRSKAVRLLAGKMSGDYELLHELSERASDKWLSTHPKRYSTFREKNLKKYLTPKEMREYKRTKKEYDRLWKEYKKRKHMRELQCTTIQLIPAKKLEKVV